LLPDERDLRPSDLARVALCQAPGTLALRKANPLGSLVLLRSNRQLWRLGGVILIQYLAFQVLPGIFTIYANYRIGWGFTEVGLSLGLVGALNITVQGLVVKRFIARYGERIA